MELFPTFFYKKYIEPNKLVLTPTEKAYLAGIVDSEGSVEIQKVGKLRRFPKFRATVTICNTNEDLMRWLRAKVPRYYERFIRPTIKTFIIYHAGIIWHLLEEIEKYAVLKRKHIQLARKLLTLKYMHWRSRSEEYHSEINKTYEEIRNLNRKRSYRFIPVENTYYEECNVEELYAYLAGVIDGDGSIYHGDNGTLQIVIGTISESYASWLHNKIEESYKFKIAKQGIWIVGIKLNYFAYKFLNNIFPYLIIKKEDASKILKKPPYVLAPI